MLVEKLDIWADFPELAEGQPESNQARTVWRWMQSGANRSPAQFPLTGKNTRIFREFVLKLSGRNGLIPLNTSDLPLVCVKQ